MDNVNVSVQIDGVDVFRETMPKAKSTQYVEEIVEVLSHIRRIGKELSTSGRGDETYKAGQEIVKLCHSLKSALRNLGGQV